MSDEGAEKVSEASPDKKRRARQKGDVPISQEANTAAALLGFGLGFLSILPFLKGFATSLRGLMLRPEEAAAALLEADLTGRLLGEGALLLLPLVAFPAAFVLVSLAVQQAIVVAPKRIKPDLKKVNPIDGAKKKFGGQALVDFARNAAKVLVLSVLGAFLLMSEAGRLVTAFDAPPAALPALLRRELLLMLAAGMAVTVAFALIDLPMVRMQQASRLKMSHQEVRDEAKENEGDQNVKGQRRKRAEKIAMNRMLKDVEKADVVVVNPTHYAVALKWERTGASLPVCVAKGTDEVALRLRSAAHAAGVPIRDDPPCARALHASVELGDSIKPEHFAAVAAAIRFADRVRKKRRAQAG